MGWGKLTRCCGAFENTNVLFLHLRLEQLDFVVGILVRLDVGFAQHAEVFGFALYKYLGLTFQARVRIDCRSVCNGMKKLANVRLVGTVRWLTFQRKRDRLGHRLGVLALRLGLVLFVLRNPNQRLSTNIQRVS